MKLWLALAAICLPLVASAGRTCKGDGKTVTGFKGDTHRPRLPCKYLAVRETCGKYKVRVTPGNGYLYPLHYLDTLWLGFEEVDGNGFWVGRTENRIAAKYLSGAKDYLFVRKDGNLETNQVLTIGKDSTSTWGETTDFRVTFKPWQPGNSDFPKAEWEFECLNSTFQAAPYPRQICGDKKADKTRQKGLDLVNNHQVIYYDVFTDTDITHTNPKCANVTRLMTSVCNEEQRRQAIIGCTDILYSKLHTNCVLKYSCDPMDVFVACVAWTCSGFQNNSACETVGRAIDQCRRFRKGDLTEKVKEENCYKDFYPINADFPQEEEEEDGEGEGGGEGAVQAADQQTAGESSLLGGGP